jgi:hypothetical protein
MNLAMPDHYTAVLSAAGAVIGCEYRRGLSTICNTAAAHGVMDFVTDQICCRYNSCASLHVRSYDAGSSRQLLQAAAQLVLAVGIVLPPGQTSNSGLPLTLHVRPTLRKPDKRNRCASSISSSPVAMRSLAEAGKFLARLS